MDQDAEYIPGARFYFEAKNIAEKGILIRDGLHYKVKNRIDIRLSLFCATPENIDMSGCEKIAPKNFAEESDEFFYKYIYIKKEI